MIMFHEWRWIGAPMKKFLLALVGIAVLLVVAVLVGPSLIDLRPRVAAAVHDATGRDLRIDGDLLVAFLPRLRVLARGIHLSNAPAAATPEMLSVDSVALEAELWPLLWRRLVIDSLVVERPTLNLEIDKDGRPNCAFQPPGKAEDRTAEKPEAQGTALGELQIGEMRLEGGRVSFRNVATGQTIDAKDINLAAAMAERESPLSLHGQMTLNDEPVKAELSVATVGKLRRGEQANVKLSIDTKHATANFDGAAQQQPVPGLNGVFDLDIPSVGKLAAWLKEPLDRAQPDPGPLKLHAVFATEGAKSMLKEATIAGTALNLKASGSVDATGGLTKVTAVVESGVLDVDRYLPPRTSDKTPTQAPAKGAGLTVPAKRASFKLSDKPFELGALRKLDADVKVSIAGVKAMGYETGRIAFTGLAKGWCTGGRSQRIRALRWQHQGLAQGRRHKRCAQARHSGQDRSCHNRQACEAGDGRCAAERCRLRRA